MALPADDTSGYKRRVSTEQTWTVDDLPEPLRAALEAAIDKKGRCPAVLRMTEIAGYTDWVLLVSGRSERHVRGITDGILDALSKRKIKPIGTDGLGEHTWDLLDFDDFLVHVFFHPVRTFYDLEKMWSDAPRVPLSYPDEVFDASEMTGLAPPEPMPGFRGTTEFGGFADEFDDDDEDPAPEPRRYTAPTSTPGTPAAPAAPAAVDPTPDDDALFDE